VGAVPCEIGGEDPVIAGGTLDASSCHGAAAFRASTTRFSATRHLRVVHGIACIRALAADLRAGTANDVMNARTAQHRVGAGGTDIGTRRQQGDVLRCCVCTSLGQAIVDGLQANRMALRAVVDARVHGLGPVVFGMVSHVDLLLHRGRESARPLHRPLIRRWLSAARMVRWFRRDGPVRPCRAAGAHPGLPCPATRAAFRAGPGPVRPAFPQGGA